MSARHEAMGAKAVDANDRQSAYGSGHDMTHHGEGKKHGEK